MFAWSAVKRLKLMPLGPAEARFSLAGGELESRIKDTLVYALGQKKMPYYRVAGIAHIADLRGVPGAAAQQHHAVGPRLRPELRLLGPARARQPCSATATASSRRSFAALRRRSARCVFVYYRVVTRSAAHDAGVEGLIILGIIITMMLADFLYDGARVALEAHAPAASRRTSHWAEPVASLLAIALAERSATARSRVLAHVGFWWHSAFVLIFLNLLPYSKHFHIITAMPNVFARNLEPQDKLPTIADLEGKVEREEPIGIGKITDLTWKDVLDLYTCTECGRCSDNCPAYTTGKKLSPKHLTLALRDHLYASEPALIDERGDRRTRAKTEPSGRGRRATHEMHHADPPEDALLRRTDKVVDLVPEHHPPRRALGLHHLPRLRRAVPGDDHLRRQDRRDAPQPGDDEGRVPGRAAEAVPRHGDQRQPVEPRAHAIAPTGPTASSIPTDGREARRRGAVLGRLRGELRRPRQEDRARDRASCSSRPASTSRSSATRRPAPATRRGARATSTCSRCWPSRTSRR